MPTIGDHLRSSRTMYWHHGLYAGDGRVLQYAGMSSLHQKDGPVEETSLEVFCAGAGYEVVEHQRRRHSPEESVRRGRSRIGEARYGLSDNNCEHFVSWCIEGDHGSGQVDVAVPTGGTIASAAVGAGAVATTVAAGGTLTGGASLMSGLATVGSVVGGGALAGVGTFAAAPAVAAAAVVSGLLLPDGEHLERDERTARRAGRVASYAGAAAGSAGAVGAVAAAGMTGISGAGITTGLAAIGGTVGGGMATGIAITAALPAVLTLGAGYGIYKAWKWTAQKPRPDGR